MNAGADEASVLIVEFKPAVLGIPRGRRPWFGSRLVGQDWQWLKDVRGRCRKFATRDSALRACREANTALRATGAQP